MNDKIHTTLYIIGHGGHARMIAASATKTFKKIIFITDQVERGEDTIAEADFLRDIQPSRVKALICGIGTIRMSEKRAELILQKYRDYSQCFVSVIDKTAYVAEGVQVGLGVYVAPHATINIGAIVGHHAIVNTAATIEHDCLIAESVHVAPRCVLGGGVSIGKMTHVGIGSVIVQSCTIAEKTTIGAASLVLTDIVEGNATYFGVPAKRKN